MRPKDWVTEDFGKIIILKLCIGNFLYIAYSIAIKRIYFVYILVMKLLIVYTLVIPIFKTGGLLAGWQ